MSRSGALRRPVLFLVAVLLGLFGALTPRLAWAADDRVDSWKVSYVVQSDGSVQATETLVYRFGSTSGRHGIQRFLTIREPMDDRNDAVYRVDDIRVASPDAPNDFSTLVDDQGRDKFLVIRVGNPRETVTAATATYTISYRVQGAMRHFDGYDEFHWDVVSGETPLVTNLEAQAEVPGGVQQVSCFTAEPGRRNGCSGSEVDEGVGRWRQAVKNPGEVMTIGVKITSGQVSNPHPILEARADRTSQLLRQGALGAGALSLLASPLVGLLVLRRHGRDFRFVGLPPGVLPAEGSKAPVALSGPIEVPVAFSPPRTSVAEAGLLVDGVIDTTETSATLVDLAVRGGIQIRGDSGLQLKLIDPAVASRPHEQVLLQRLFNGMGAGAEVDVAEQGSMMPAHQALELSVRNQVAENSWFTDMPSARSAGLGFLLVGMCFFGFLWSGVPLTWWLVVPLIPALVTYWFVSAKLKRGQRSAVGRAVADQAEGFRRYIATAEADQLRFEEGEDIFSRYLPWAVAFGLADRWADVCAELVRMGRLSAAPPSWYLGHNWNFYVWQSQLGMLERAGLPQISMPSSGGSSGSGWGGGSSFGGGGFAGGGGGGGGVGSW